MDGIAQRNGCATPLTVLYRRFRHINLSWGVGNLCLLY